MERDNVPQLTQKDLEMAEKVSKYNVSCVFHYSFLTCGSETQEVIFFLKLTVNTFKNTFNLCTSWYQESKRAESLMSLHTKKMKEKAQEKADTPVERRPFDRDADLQVNRFDDAQKQRLLKKSQELNTRFSHSKDKMFL